MSRVGNTHVNWQFKSRGNTRLKRSIMQREFVMKIQIVIFPAAEEYFKTVRLIDRMMTEIQTRVS